MNAVNLTIDGQPITMNFGLLAFRLYTEHHGITLNELGQHMEKNSAIAVGDMMYFAYQAHCQINGKEVLVNIYQATEWLSEISEDDLEKVQEAMMDVRLMGKTVRESTRIEKKSAKKATMKKK